MNKQETILLKDVFILQIFTTNNLSQISRLLLQLFSVFLNYRPPPITYSHFSYTLEHLNHTYVIPSPTITASVLCGRLFILKSSTETLFQLFQMIPLEKLYKLVFRSNSFSSFGSDTMKNNEFYIKKYRLPAFRYFGSKDESYHY